MELFHPPVATHDVTFVELQVSVEVAPFTMVVGFADNEIVGSGAAFTATVVVAIVDPPDPIHIRV